MPFQAKFEFRRFFARMIDNEGNSAACVSTWTRLKIDRCLPPEKLKYSSTCQGWRELNPELNAIYQRTIHFMNSQVIPSFGFI